MLPPWQKRRFCHFLYFRRGGNVDFADFCISAMAETSFFAFFAHPRPRTDKKTVKFGIDHTTENGKSRLAVCGKIIAPALSDDAERGDGKDFRKRNVRTNRRVCR